MERVLRLYKQHRSFVFYVFFGFCTTIINISTFCFCNLFFLFTTLPSTAIAWVSANLFAYLTNRRWVFGSSAKNIINVIVEMITFFICRLGTGLVDVVFMYLFVDVINMNGVFMKAFSNVIMIILNYVASKMVVFRKRKANG